MKNISGRFWITASIVFIVDRVTKMFVENPVKNSGTLFGIGSGNNLLFLMMSVAILCGMYAYRKSLLKTRWSMVMAGMVVGGALGNMLDRLLYGYVIDFINLKIWPVFNISDAAITVAVLGLLWEEFRK